VKPQHCASSRLGRVEVLGAVAAVDAHAAPVAVVAARRRSRRRRGCTPPRRARPQAPQFKPRRAARSTSQPSRRVAVAVAAAVGARSRRSARSTQPRRPGSAPRGCTRRTGCARVAAGRRAGAALVVAAPGGAGERHWPRSGRPGRSGRRAESTRRSGRGRGSQTGWSPVAGAVGVHVAQRAGRPAVEARAAASARLDDGGVDASGVDGAARRGWVSLHHAIKCAAKRSAGRCAAHPQRSTCATGSRVSAPLKPKVVDPEAEAPAGW
jgi:hypothetical protein